MPNDVRLTARVSGRVQGVGYRFFVRREAASRGLRGFARNLADGRVEVVAEGPRHAVEALLVALERGPSAAEVESIDAEWSAAEGDFASFGIRH